MSATLPARDLPDAVPADAGDPGLRRRLAVLGVWTAFAVLEAGKQFLDMRLRGTPVGVSDVVIQNFPWWYTWALLTPVVVALARRFRLDVPGARRRSIAVHLPAAFVLPMVHVLLAGTLFFYTTSRGNEHPMLRVPVSLPIVWRTWYDNFLALEVLTYFAIVGAVYAVDFHARWRESALVAARLTARAAALEHRASEARLAALRMELHPHFLFNTLNAISGLVRKRENDVAVTMLARLGDLLRATLDRGAEPETTVREELALLGHYLAIEQTRFADRLTCAVTCEPGTEDALLPPLILQPIVENAIRHGIARRPGPGAVRVDVRHDWRGSAPVLLVDVRDTGDGLRNGPTREGVGLSNTRARLDALYGADAGLTLANAEGGGARATLWLPLRTRTVAGAVGDEWGAVAVSSMSSREEGALSSSPGRAEIPTGASPLREVRP